VNVVVEHLFASNINYDSFKSPIQLKNTRVKRQRMLIKQNETFLLLEYSFHNFD